MPFIKIPTQEVVGETHLRMTPKNVDYYYRPIGEDDDMNDSESTDPKEARRNCSVRKTPAYTTITIILT